MLGAETGQGCSLAPTAPSSRVPLLQQVHIQQVSLAVQVGI
jgi:hypothetical protein